MPTGHIAQSAMTAKILCKKHNSDLSPLDAEAGRLGDILLKSAAGQAIGRAELNGSLIERWALKTLINGLVAGWSDKRKWMPHGSIVRAIFGKGDIPQGCGLYSVDGDSLDLPNPQAASVTPIWTGTDPMTKKLLGGYVRINGLRLFVALHDQVVLQIVGSPENPPRVFESDRVRFVHRPAFIAVGELGYAREGVILRW